MRKRVAAYVRVSTDRQVQGEGIATQETAIARYARRARLEVVATFRDEGESGALAERDGWADAEHAVRSGEVAGIVVYKLDRLARDVMVQEQLMAGVWRLGGEIYSTAADENNLRDDPEDPTRKLVRRMMGIIAEYERDMIVLRMKRGRRVKARAGGFAYGSPPFGYRVADGALEPDPTEQATLRAARRLRRRGLSTRAIAADLNAAGHRTKRGREWSSSSVSAALTRPRPKSSAKVGK